MQRNDLRMLCSIICAYYLFSSSSWLQYRAGRMTNTLAQSRGSSCPCPCITRHLESRNVKRGKSSNAFVLVGEGSRAEQSRASLRCSGPVRHRVQSERPKCMSDIIPVPRHRKMLGLLVLYLKSKNCFHIFFPSTLYLLIQEANDQIFNLEATKILHHREATPIFHLLLLDHLVVTVGICPVEVISNFG